jgi:hypothetical protein
MGPVEKAVRDDIEQLGDLVGVEPSLSEMAYRLAREVDGVAGRACEACGEPVAAPDDAKLLPALSKELRATLAQLLAARVPEEDDDDLGDLGSAE